VEVELLEKPVVKYKILSISNVDLLFPGLLVILLVVLFNLRVGAKRGHQRYKSKKRVSESGRKNQKRTRSHPFKSSELPWAFAQCALRLAGIANFLSQRWQGKWRSSPSP